MIDLYINVGATLVVALIKTMAIPERAGARPALTE
jgi:hypothetical protein